MTYIKYLFAINVFLYLFIYVKMEDSVLKIKYDSYFQTNERVSTIYHLGLVRDK